MLKRKIFMLAAFFIMIMCGISYAKEVITSLSQLNNPEYKIGTDDYGPTHDAAVKEFPKAKFAYFNDETDGYVALKGKKIDAFVLNQSEAEAAIKNGIEGIKILPGFLGDPIKVAAGISRKSKIPGIKEKFNAFIAGLKADGTFNEMYERWFIDGDIKMPDDIKIPEKSNIHLNVGTTGIAVPCTFYAGNELTGFDIEIAKRFAAYLGADLKFTVYDYSSAFTVGTSQNVDMALANLYVTPEREETMNFSDVMYTINTVVAVRDEAPVQAVIVDSSVKNFDGKRIAVPTGTINDEIVKEVLPSAKILYFETDADTVGAVLSGKADAYADDEEVLKAIIKTNDKLTMADGYLKNFDNALIFAKTPKCNKLRGEFNEYFRRIKSDGTLNNLDAIWFGDNENLKTLSDYENLPDINGVVKIASSNESAPFVYVKDGKIAGYEADIIVHFCREKGYKPVFVAVNFPSIIPSIVSEKCDIGMGAITITEERAQSVNFSVPTYQGGTKLLTLKTSTSKSSNEIKTPENSSKLSELDFAGKKIGVQVGTTCAELVPEKFPLAKVSFFNSIPDALTALKTGKIDAVCCALPSAVYVVNEDKNLEILEPYLREAYLYSLFVNSDRGKKLCEEYSDYLKTLWDNGTIDELANKWLGPDESKKTVEDYSKLPAPNGILKMAVDSSIAPFAYVKDNEITGHAVDLAVRFCKAKGYGLEISDMSLSAVIASVKAGKCDFTQGMTKSKERGENTLFATSPSMKSGNVILTMKNKKSEKPASSALYTDISQFNGKKIGVPLGTDNGQLVEAKIPGAEVVYFNDVGDIIVALKNRKIDAVCCSLISAKCIMRQHDDVTYIPQFLRESFRASTFPKTDKGRKLCAEYAEFIKSLEDNGTLEKLFEKWTNPEGDTPPQLDDYGELPATNGTLKLATDTELEPFSYIVNNKIQGYDVELAVMFCKAKGYGLEFVPMNISGILAAIRAEKCDFSVALTYTEERAQTVLFSPKFNSKPANVLAVMKEKKSEQPLSAAMSKLEGKRIGVVTGSTHPEIAAKHVPTAELVYFDNAVDEFTALKARKIDATCTGIPLLRRIMAEDDSIMPYGEQLTFTEGAPIFQKSEEGEKLCAQFSEFAKACWNNGTIKELEAFWFDQEESKCIMKDYSNLPAPNGVLKAAINEVSPPFIYVKDNRFVGFDIEFVYKFCEAYGYGIEFMPMRFAGIIPAVTSGKADFGIAAITITDERKESVLFSYPNVRTGNVFAVRKDMAVQGAETETLEPTFFDELKASFERTFIREDRYKLFIEGIKNTMIITVLSILFGMILGFTVFMLCRTGNIFANLMTKFSVWLIKGTPVVVLLMILYYIIFGSVDINGLWVAVIAFSLTFGTSVYRMLTFGTGALDKGQTEAAYALGYTDLQTFFTIILPQAALHFMPSFREEVTVLIKSTAVVGYIAVQDLTKMGDIVRSRTYEAFFPLIAVAIIYFILAGMLNVIVVRIHWKITPSKRKPEDILKGIKMN